jgi:hypothetical protein
LSAHEVVPTITSDDNTSRNFQVFIEYRTILGDITICVFRSSFSAAVGWTPVGRRFIVPPNGTVTVTVDALAAGKLISLKGAYLEMPLGQSCPRD